MKKIHNADSWEDEFFASCMCFLTFLKTWKNAFLLLTFLKQVLWTWKYVQKKLVIGPDLHQKFHRNWVISWKYTILQKVFISISTSRYDDIITLSRKFQNMGNDCRCCNYWEQKINTSNKRAQSNSAQIIRDKNYKLNFLGSRKC